MGMVTLITDLMTSGVKVFLTDDGCDKLEQLRESAAQEEGGGGAHE